VFRECFESPKFFRVIWGDRKTANFDEHRFLRVVLSKILEEKSENWKEQNFKRTQTENTIHNTQ